MPQKSSTAYGLNKFHVFLENRIRELEVAVRRRDSIAVERTSDLVEELQRASERALAVSNLDRESQDLRNARAALRRLLDGTFGVCEQCETEIHPKRLAIIPWAAFCVHCQEELDRRYEAKRTLTANSLGNGHEQWLLAE